MAVKPYFYFHNIFQLFIQTSLASLIIFSSTNLPFLATSVAESPVAVVEEAAAEDIPTIIEAEAAESGINPSLARRIAFCESSFRHSDATGAIIRGKNNVADVGLFQINEKYHLKKSRELGFNIYALEGNIGYALWLIKNEGTKHWRWSRNCWKK